jgi:hypothetical protein
VTEEVYCTVYMEKIIRQKYTVLYIWKKLLDKCCPQMLLDKP